MRHAFLLLAVLFAACAPRVVVVEPAPPASVRPAPAPRPQPTGFVVNARIGLSAYPGSVALKREDRDGSSEVDFETRDPIDEVYAYFHNQLLSRGWTRVRLEAKGAATKVEAAYQRGGERFTLELDQQGRSGRYRLEIEF